MMSSKMLIAQEATPWCLLLYAAADVHYSLYLPPMIWILTYSASSARIHYNILISFNMQIFSLVS